MHEHFSSFYPKKRDFNGFHKWTWLKGRLHAFVWPCTHWYRLSAQYICKKLTVSAPRKYMNSQRPSKTSVKRWKRVNSEKAETSTLTWVFALTGKRPAHWWYTEPGNVADMICIWCILVRVDIKTSNIFKDLFSRLATRAKPDQCSVILH